LFHADGQTDRYDETNSRFSQFCVCAYEVRMTSAKVPSNPPTVRSQPPARQRYISQFVPLTSCHISTELYQRDGRPTSGVSRDGRAAKPKFPLMCLQSQLSCKTLVLATCCLWGNRPYHIRHFAKRSDILPLLQSV